MTTIKDIAAKAGVSVSTVSRILNKQGNYSKKTIDKILSIANNLNYQKNENASELAQAKNSNVIGVILTTAQSSFLSKIIDGIEDTAYRNNMRVLLAHCGHFDKDRLHNCLTLMMGQKVRGIISISVQFDEDNLKLLQKSDLKLISLNVQVPGYPAISINNYDAAYVGTQYLINQGHKKIALVSIEDNDPQTGYERTAGYTKALLDNGIFLDKGLIIPGDYSFESGKQNFKDSLSLPTKPTAFFAGSDDAAAGVISSAITLGYNIPNDFSVLGFDDSKISEMINPELSTIHQPFYEMGQNGVLHLIDNDLNSKNFNFNIIKRNSIKHLY